MIWEVLRFLAFVALFILGSGFLVVILCVGFAFVLSGKLKGQDDEILAGEAMRKSSEQKRQPRAFIKRNH